VPSETGSAIIPKDGRILKSSHRRFFMQGFLLAVLLLFSMETVEAIPLESWSNKINGQSRFVVFGELSRAGVLDRETGLVWERDPTAIGSSGQESEHCQTPRVV
jgi:hypothetical protein